MDDYTDLCDPDDDDGDDTGDDNTRLVGRHTEAECRLYRGEMARREAYYQALGVGRQYRRLVAATRGELPEPARKALPLRKQLPAPKDEPPTGPDSREED